MSRLPFELLLALRYLRPKRTFVSVITLISIIGVTLGVAVLIIVISVMTGFDAQLRDSILGFTAHLKLDARTPLADYRRMMTTIASNANVRSVSPYVIGQVLLKTQPAFGSPLMAAPGVRGIDSKLESGRSLLLTNIISGTNDLRGRGVLVGSGFAERMNLRPGDTLALYSIHDAQKAEQLWAKGRAKGELDEGVLPTEFEVRGIFRAGYYEFDSSFVVTSLANAQDLFDLGDSVGGLFINLKDPDKARAVGNELLETLGDDFRFSTWEEENSSILTALVVEKNVMFYLLFFITIVAAFGITSALITFVVQKTREIGILKALGASARQVMWVFLGQSLIVGVFGVASGYGLGILAVHYRNEFLTFMRRTTGWQLFPAEIYHFSELPARIIGSDIAVICGGSLVICLLAGLLPAWNAGRLKPVEALRHE